MTETRTDAFLNGRLQVCQPVNGYRAGADPVFLAAAVIARSGDTVLDLGCGVGVASLALLHRVDGARVTGVELQPELAELARKNAPRNGLHMNGVTADLSDLPPELKDQSFDHVITNPPFFDRSGGSHAAVPSRETGRGLTLELSTWLDTGLKRLKSGGSLTMINRIESLPEVLAAIDKRAGDITVLPLAARRARAAKLYILKARKDAKGGFKLLSPFVLHRGDAHEKDEDSYTDLAQSVLRDGAALDFPA